MKTTAHGNSGTTAANLQDMVSEAGLFTVFAALTSKPNLLVDWAIDRGWDLTGWTAKTVPGCILFVPVDDQGALRAGVGCVAYLNAVEADRPKWAATLASVPDTILVMARDEFAAAGPVPF